MAQTNRQVRCPYCGSVWDAEFSEDGDDVDLEWQELAQDVHYVVCENCIHYAN